MRHLCPVLLILLLAWPTQAQPKNGNAQAPPPALVVTAPVEQETVRTPMTLVGSTEPQRTTTVAAEAEGRVLRLEAREGQAVEAHEPLASLRTTPLELELAERRAALREVRARLEKAAADQRRIASLFDQGFVSEEELQGRRTEEEALKRQAQRIEADIERLEDRLGRMTIRAPFAGWVIEESTEVGEWLSTGDAVLLLADLSTMKVTVPMPERRISDIAVGDRVELRFDALPQEVFEGRLDAVVPQADVASRTFPVQIAVKNPAGRILAGMLARATFYLGAPRPALLVPKDALIPQPGGDGTLVKVDDGRARPVPVRITGSHGARYAVEAVDGGLTAGDRVVVRGNERVRPGQPVREAAGAGEQR